VTEAELRRAITAVEAAYVFRNETVEGLGRSYGHAEAIWRLSDELAYVSRVRQVTREHLRDAARRILVLDRYARVALVPRRDS
jgi:predicted Zn-dependent peptidase